jgi:hypothetical protein
MGNKTKLTPAQARMIQTMRDDFARGATEMCRNGIHCVQCNRNGYVVAQKLIDLGIVERVQVEKYSHLMYVRFTEGGAA